MQSLAQILYLQLFLWVSFAEILSLMTLKKSGGGEANILQNKYKINKMHFNCIVKSILKMHLASNLQLWDYCHLTAKPHNGTGFRFS